MLALTGYEIGLATVALAFVAFALIAALAIPRARPEFPGNRLGLFIGICAVFFLAQMGAVLALTELGHAEEAAEEVAPEPEPTEPLPTTDTGTTDTETTDTETTGPESPTETAPEDPSGSEAAGEEIFVAQCGACHTLADAGTTGSVGPNLDSSQPPSELVVDRVTNGQGAMPSFADTLSEEQIADVAAYVTAVAGS